MNILIGIALIGLGVFSFVRIISGKGKKSERLVFFHQLAVFIFLFGKQNAYKALVITISIIEIVFGIAFLLGKLNWSS